MCDAHLAESRVMMQFSSKVIGVIFSKSSSLPSMPSRNTTAAAIAANTATAAPPHMCAAPHAAHSAAQEKKIRGGGSRLAYLNLEKDKEIL